MDGYEVKVYYQIVSLQLLSLRRFACQHGLVAAVMLACSSLAHATARSVPAQYATIQAAVNAASNGDTVLVADGTYSGAGSRDIDFGGKNLTVTSQNGPAKTILDCGGHASADGSGNHRGFYIHSGEMAVTISGFTVKNGYETYAPSLANSDEGGGICLVNTGSGTFTLANCIVSGNNASEGGGISNDNYTADGTITLINCIVSGNTALDGGGVSNNAGGGTITLTNCIVYGDTGGEVGGVSTITAAYSDVQGSYPGTGNLNADPKFVNAAGGDYHLQAGSPCLGAGTHNGAPTTDKDGNPRPNPSSIGAYELIAPTHILWTKTDRRIVLWSLTPDGAVTPSSYGPFPAYTANALAESGDEHLHLLWNSPTKKTIVLWDIAPGSNPTSVTYGPFPAFTAKAIAAGKDNHVHVLWSGTHGQVVLWDIAPGGSPVSTTYTPAPNFTPAALAVGPDGDVHVLWNQNSGAVTLWDIGGDGTPAGVSYGPFSGFHGQSLATGADGSSHLLWDKTTGGSVVWDLAGGGGVSDHSYGPFPGWTALAITAKP